MDSEWEDVVKDYVDYVSSEVGTSRLVKELGSSWRRSRNYPTQTEEGDPILMEISKLRKTPIGDGSKIQEYLQSQKRLRPVVMRQSPKGA